MFSGILEKLERSSWQGKRVLFVKIGAIGDVVMALPLSRALRAQGAHVTWLVGRLPAPLVREYSEASEIIEVDDLALLAGGLALKLWTALKVFFRLLARSFDLILIGHSDPRYRLLVLGALGRKTFFRQPSSPGDFRHHSYDYVALADATIDPGRFLPRPRKAWTGKGSRIVSFAPGGAKNLLADDFLRRWPLTHYRALAERLLAAGYRVEILGAASDEWVLESFSGLPVQSQIGKLNLLELVETLAEREALITHDSGPLHLGGLAGLPVLGLFGPTKAQWRFPLKNPGHALELTKPLPCQPCYNGKAFAPCKDNQCLSQITPDQVFEALKEITES